MKVAGSDCNSRCSNILRRIYPFLGDCTVVGRSQDRNSASGVVFLRP